jgi:hypothetical protein
LDGSFGYDLVRITPTPIPLRRRSGYFPRAFSACFLVWNGFDRGVNSPPTYSKSNQQIFTAPENMLADAQVAPMYVFAADWSQIIESAYILNNAILVWNPADLVVVTHGTFCPESQLWTCDGVRVVRPYDGESWKKYQDPVVYRIDELSIRGGQSIRKVHSHRSSSQVSESTVLNLVAQLFEALFINEGQIRSANWTFQN